ncbi:hypothetical protein LSCM1_01426 [Leishmania martiniquensis]|uniref:Uncharacterized protein n=1 Tax=Leishmania martiniquensis TaxID=1580590 RepID=A0A836GT28_9TRYP|nr:hypothetical protein LSCM1_01426 [Leishmania martiniquensis]
MGASPSREAQDQYLDELRERKQKAWRVDRRRKEVSLLPLTKKFMHYVQPDPATRPDSRTSSNSSSHSSHTDTNTSSTSRSSRRDYCPGQLCLDAAPASLPFVQQLYNAYREPGIQFYCRKESWGKMNELPQDLYYPTVESFYAATVSCYEEDLYETNEDMQQAYDQQKLTRRLWALGPSRKGPASTQPSRTYRQGPSIRPTPCAICFEYPTSSIAPSERGEGASPAANAHRCGAPHGSVVFAPHCSFMVVGFVGLVPARQERARACAEAFLRPPAESAGSDGEGKCAGTREEPAEYELVAFISKSAGEQHLGRALFQAAFLYVDQCRRAGLPGNPPLPSTRFACFLMDVPSLCFLREVRLRCAELQWTRRLARALRRIRIAAHHLAAEMSDAIASELCAFMAECFVKLDFHPSPTTPACLFAGFVGDAGSAVVVDASAAFPSAAIHAAPLPTSASAEVKALLKSRADGDGLFGHGGGSTVGGGSRGGAKGSTDGGAPAAAGAGAETVKVVCVVGTNQLTVGSAVYPHATVLERAVEVSTGAFVEADWAVAQDLSGHEALAIDFYDADPEDEWDYSICVRAPGEREPRPTAVVSDIILSWSKNLYVQARLADTSDSHWVNSYPLDYYTATQLKATPSFQTSALNAGPSTHPPLTTATPAAQGAKDGTARTSPLTTSNVKALSRASPADIGGQRVVHAEGDADANTTPSAHPEATAPGFYLWEFEHQGRFYTIGLVPNFVRATRRGCSNAGNRNSSNRRNKSSDTEKNAPAAVAAASAGGDVIRSAVDPMSEADVSSAASQHYANSRSYSGLSSRSGETYRTAGSSHSTMSNLHLVGGRRTVRQRRMVLSLRTGQAYENGVPVSNAIPPVSGGRHSRALSDTGSSARNESGADAHAGSGADTSSKRLNHSDGTAVAPPMGSGDKATLDELGGGYESDDAYGGQSFSGRGMPRSCARQQAKRYVNTPYEHSSQQFQPPQALQRRLSGGAGGGCLPKAEARAPFQWQRRLALDDDGAAGNGIPSLHGFGPGGYSDGLVDYTGCEELGETDMLFPESMTRVTAPAAGVETLQHWPKEEQLGQYQISCDQGVLGPLHSLAQGGKGAPEAELVVGSASGAAASPQPPVLQVTAYVQEVKDSDGRTKLRWDWRGLPRK